MHFKGVQMKKTTVFIGREAELVTLNQAHNKKTAQLIVIRGRRRIGKSRLIEEFVKGKQHFRFAGIAPESAYTAQTQRDFFTSQLAEQTSLPNMQVLDWVNLFNLLAKQTHQKPVTIIFDEITWMSDKDPTFLGKLKEVWDVHFSQNPALTLILCGSVSTWIEKNIISSSGFLGRITLTLNLRPLALPSCNQLLDYIGFKRSVYEKFIILAITGGIPWYILQIDKGKSALENIATLCFTQNGLFVDEYQKIFHDLFASQTKICQKIVELLSKGPAEYTAIAEKLQYAKSGVFSQYLNDLVLSGFVSRDYSWHFKNGKNSTISLYRLSDNFVRFYLKYVLNKVDNIKRGQFDDIKQLTLPSWQSIMGLQFENLILNNRALIKKQLGILPEDVVSDNPYFQRQTKAKAGCQIDYLIQTRFNVLYICEVKFSRHPVESCVIKTMQAKIAHLAKPKHFSCCPVLIHVNGVSEVLEETEYFTHILNFSNLLNGDSV
jgi:uncharacterized protein